MSGGSTATELDALSTVRLAVSVVCEVDGSGLSADTRFADLGADSLARVSIADVVEAEFAARGCPVHLDDAMLGRMATLGDLVRDLGPGRQRQRPAGA